MREGFQPSLASAFAWAYTVPTKIALESTGAMVSSTQPTLHSANSDVQAESLPLLPLTVLVPVFNDWEAVAHLLERLDSVFGEHAFSGHILLIDDGSLEALPEQFPKIPPRNIQQIQSVELRTNLGHQRALCVGLVHLRQSNVAAPVVIMDADGEDSPSDIPRLLEKFVGEGKRKVIFAARGLRAEGFVFKFFYKLYRTIHRMVVGFDPRFGNFSVLPATILDRLVVTSDLWNHYAATVVKMKLPYATVPIDRARRFAGESKMGFVGLVIHGLSAMSVFGDTVGVRLLILCGISGVLTAALIIAALVIKFATHLSIPGWATYVTGLLLLLLSQLVVLSLVFIFVALYSRGQSSFVPIRDCPIYIGRVRTVFSRHG
ncbi:MAG TPA: glycosyltransferase [Candidatus Binataceae bacterium]|jgi:glycosyltransferase involved in cell wall biosynthesis|nr:glycosyltransferase [Candidatus Binataceae bacterium]